MKKPTVNANQAQTIVFWVEEGLNKNQIAKRLSISRTAVGEYWKKDHFLRALKIAQDKWDTGMVPQLESTWLEIRDKTLEQIKGYLDDSLSPKEKMSARDLIALSKRTSEALAELKPEDNTQKAKELAKNFLEQHLTPNELQGIARRILSGDKEPITLIEAEDVGKGHIRQLEPGSREGDNQEGDTG